MAESGRHSRNGLWWWDGSAWCAAYSTDGLWWWNGVEWRPSVERRVAPKGVPKSLIWQWVFWTPLLVAWVPTIFLVADQTHGSRQAIIVAASITGGLAVAGTLLLGIMRGRRKQWSYLGISLLLGVAATGFVVFSAFALSQPPNAPDDPGLGLGAALVTAMVGFASALIMWFGAAVGLLIRRLSPPNR